MPSTIQDFLRTYMGMAEMQQRQQQIEEQKRSAQVAGLSTMLTLARQTTNPATHALLAKRASQMGLGNEVDLLGILQNVAPTTEAIQGERAAKGTKVLEGGSTGTTPEADAVYKAGATRDITGLTPGGLGGDTLLADLFKRFGGGGAGADALAAALGTRTATGVLPGALGMDTALAGLSPTEQQQGAGIGLGTRVSAQQAIANAQAAAGMEINWANLREQATHNRATEAQGQASLGLSAQELAMKAKAASGPAIPDPSNIASMVSTKASMLKELTSSKEPPMPMVIMNYIGLLNTINRQLDLAGVPNEGQIEYKPEDLVDPGWMLAFKRRMQGVNPTVLKPRGVQK